jgi:hypothetical protein
MSALVDVLVAGTFVVWVVAILLIRAARHFPDIRSLRERAVTAAVIAFGGTMYLLAALSVEVGGWWDQDTSRVIARISVLMIELIPGLYWLWLYSKGFGGKRR